MGEKAAFAAGRFVPAQSAAQRGEPKVSARVFRDVEGPEGAQKVDLFESGLPEAPDIDPLTGADPEVALRVLAERVDARLADAERGGVVVRELPGVHVEPPDAVFEKADPELVAVGHRTEGVQQPLPPRKRVIDGAELARRGIEDADSLVLGPDPDAAVGAFGQRPDLLAEHRVFPVIGDVFVEDEIQVGAVIHASEQCADPDAPFPVAAEHAAALVRKAVGIEHLLAEMGRAARTVVDDEDPFVGGDPQFVVVALDVAQHRAVHFGSRR